MDGRLNDHFIHSGKYQVHLHLYRQILEQRQGILEYQVCQTPGGEDVDTLTSSHSSINTRAIKQLLEDERKKTGIAGANIRVEIVASIRHTAAKKLPHFFAR